MHEEKFYRSWVDSGDLVSFEVREKETDLFILADKVLQDQAKSSLHKYRQELENYIAKRRIFKETLAPLEPVGGEPLIVKEMLDAANLAGVGPMASVAGAVSDFVGMDLLGFSKELIIENGGDIFVNTLKERLFGIFAGRSPFSGKIALRIKPRNEPFGVCASSATVGPSLSLGNTDATVVISKKASIADAFATAIGNMVKSEADLKKAASFAKENKHIIGVLIIIQEKIAAWGDIEIVKL